MKGFSGFKSSPMEQAGRMMGMQGFQGAGDIEKWGDIFSTEATFKKGKPFSTTTSFTTPKIAQLKLGRDKNISIGGKISARSEDASSGFSKFLNTFNQPKTQASLTGKYNFAGDTGPRGLHSGFQGSLSGDIGIGRDKMKSKKGKLTYGGKLSLGAGTKSYNIKGFGEHTSKSHISGGGTKFGIEGKAGVFSGSAGYNIKTKQPEFKLGFNI